MAQTNLDGFNKIDASVGENIVVASVKAGGTANTAFNSVTLDSPATIDGSSNDGAGDAFLAGSGDYVIPVDGSTFTLGVPNDFRQNAEVDLGVQIVSQYGGMNRILAGKEPNVSGYTVGREGQWIASDGTVIRNVDSTGFVNYVVDFEIADGEGDEPNVIDAGQSYYYVVGGNITTKTLAARNLT